MTMEMLKGKIHRATVVQAELNYVGSITVDQDLLDASGILEYEKVQIVDIDNGSRFETYTIAGERGSGMICLNGAAARCVSVGDKIILMSYAQMTPEEVKNDYHPNVVFVDEQNHIARVTTYEKHGLLKDGVRNALPTTEVRIRRSDTGGAEMENLKGKCVLLCVTGGIAAYKIPNVASALRKAGAEVHVIMTQNATQFITPLTFETLTNNRCVVDTFARDFQYDVTHISLAQAADLILIAPATADVIAKLAHGIADDMLTTVVLAAKCKKLVSPAMNTAMLENPITQDNIATLKKYGFEIIPPASGLLACQAVGSGKMPEPEVLLDHIAHHLARRKTLAGVNITVTAGPTQEALDPVRYLTNHSTGRMGYAIAREAMLRGANVTLVSGPTELGTVPFVDHRPVTSAGDMFRAIQDLLPQTDILIKAAAVADYRPANVAEDKMKKKDGDLSIPLERTQDILGWVAENRHPGLFVCGFSMETKDMIANSQAKLERKKLDMIVANNLKVAGAGFGVSTNVVTLITKDGLQELPRMGKDEVAAHLLDEIQRRR